LIWFDLESSFDSGGCWRGVLECQIAKTFWCVVSMEAQFETNNDSIFFKKPMQLWLLHIFGNVLYENLRGLLSFPALWQVLFEPQSAALFATYLEIPDFLTHLYVILISRTRNLHISLKELLLDVSMDNRNIV
jgi:hypothetical protein